MHEHSSFATEGSKIPCHVGVSCRRPKYPNASWLIASALVISASAFQNNVPRISRSNIVSTKRFPTAQWVVTEPDTILRMDPAEGKKPELGAFEDVYILSTDYERRPGDNLPSPSRVKKPRRKSPKKISVTTRKGGRVRRGGSTSGGEATLNVIDSSSGERASMTTNLPQRVSKARQRVQEKTRETIATHGKRSSTMPGFVERGMSGRQRAFDDGIKMAEQRSGKQISKIVDTPGMCDNLLCVQHSLSRSVLLTPCMFILLTIYLHPDIPCYRGKEATKEIEWRGDV